MKQRRLDLDVINILAIIMVIGLHHNGLVHSFHDTLGWRQSLVVECLFYPAVPLFLMNSGITLLNYRSKYSTAVFFQKRFVRTVIPWLFWSFFYLFLYIKVGRLRVEPPTIKQALYLLMNNKIETVFWYFSALFACYLAMPVFSKLISDRKLLWYIVLLNFFFLSLLPLVNQALDFSWSLDVPVVGSLILYPILGYLLDTTALSQRQRRGLYLLGLFGLAFHFGFRYYLSILHQTADTTVKGYSFFHCVFYSAAVFELLKNVDWNFLPDRIKKALPFLSSCSFGIYLIHRGIMHLEMHLLHMTNMDLIWRTACIPLTYILCLCIVAAMRKIPIVNYVVGG